MVPVSRQLVLAGCFVVAAALGALACTPAAPPPRDAERPPALPSAAAAPAPPAPPALGVPSSASVAPPPASAAAPPPPVRADGPFVTLFTKDKRVVYMATDEVDTHDAHPGKSIAKRTARVTFTVKTVENDAGTWLAEGEWAPVDEGERVLDGGSPPGSWRLRGDGIEIGDDGDHVVLVTATASRTAPKNGVCHVTKDKGMYGPTKREICFDALGLVRYAEENLHGPRKFSVARARR